MAIIREPFIRKEFWGNWVRSLNFVPTYGDVSSPILFEPLLRRPIVVFIVLSLFFEKTHCGIEPLFEKTHCGIYSFTSFEKIFILTLREKSYFSRLILKRLRVLSLFIVRSLFSFWLPSGICFEYLLVFICVQQALLTGSLDAILNQG